MRQGPFSPSISKSRARQLWMRAQGLDVAKPFGSGKNSVIKAVRQLGYVQIDTISVVERCHHHILFSRIPDYKRASLVRAQSLDKSIFEYWTHALAYIPTEDYRFFLPRMKLYRKKPSPYFNSVTKAELHKVSQIIKTQGPLAIRDIKDDILVEKSHAWGSRKPSKKALELGFHSGLFTISERLGMQKKYELSIRHFAWQDPPTVPTATEVLDYQLDRALRAQAIITVDSVSHLAQKPYKIALSKRIQARVKKGELMGVEIEGIPGTAWMRPEDFESRDEKDLELTHILSPFDPLIIQRKRLCQLFGYEHRFEAYIPKEKRQWGYFALPVLVGDKVVAALDLKTDRKNNKLLQQRWTWMGKNKSPALKKNIEEALHLFEKFQLEA